MATPTQTDRTIAVHTPLGPDKLVLASFAGNEEMSRLFHYSLEMLSAEDWIDPEKLVGHPVHFSVKQADREKLRWFHGYVSRLAAGSRESGMRRYTADVVPWLWFLTRTANCRVFQEKTVQDIVDEVLGEYGFSDYEWKLTGQYEKRIYCVQYHESDFNFISRLLESEGIYYYFKHEQADAGPHTMVLSDGSAGYFSCDESKVDYAYTEKDSDEDTIFNWSHEFEYIPGGWAQTDYNCETHPARDERTPAKHLLASEKSVVKLPQMDKYEVFDYPAEGRSPAECKRYTKLRMEEAETAYDNAQGGSTCKTFAVGGKFSFRSHDCEFEVGKEYLITSVSHSAVEPASYDQRGAAGDYSNGFSCMPASTVYRPRRMTAQPRIQGTQTAVVVGPDGKEIHTDELGRIKVQFYWDRFQKRKETSCWIRCAQLAAGKGWGMMSIPRIGQEVVVTFEEGNPDRPLVTGVVYNNEQTPPYALPEHATKTVLKTNSSPGGDGYNEIRLEDAKDKEQIYIHGQKDVDVRVEHDWEELVKRNRSEAVGGDYHLSVGGNEHHKVGEKLVEHVSSDHELKVDGHRPVNIGGNGLWTVGDNSFVSTGTNKNESVGSEMTLKVGTDYTVSLGGKYSLTSDNQHIQTSFYGLKAGNMNITADDLCIQAGSISLSCGGSFITIDSSGVSIVGPLVRINSGGSAGFASAPEPAMAADATPAAEAAPADPAEPDDSKTGAKSTPY